jgi:hypothetical protein
MSTQLNNSGVTFPDSTTQTTAATAGISGIFGQAFTSSGTFTVPAGVTALKVSVLGGGGGGGGATVNGSNNVSAGSAGGTSSFGSYVSATGGAGGASAWANYNTSSPPPAFGTNGSNGTAYGTP